MCGIIGYKGYRPAGPIIIEGLRRLEYRGYDSAGIAIRVENGDVWVYKRKGKIEELVGNLNEIPSGNTGIGHTRWATHGPPSDENAHPHIAGKVIVVHNGIIENYESLKKKLERKGRKFTSNTDSEVIAHLVDAELCEGKTLKTAIFNALKKLRGSYAVLFMLKEHEDILVGARNGSPLVLGKKDGEFFFASDIPALSPFVNSVFYLKDGEVAWVEKESVKFYTLSGRMLEKEVKEVGINPSMVEKGEFKHFMIKEINEQPDGIWNTFLSLSEGVEKKVLKEVAEEISEADCLYLTACGTSFHAAMIGAVWFEEISGMPAFPLLASEERHRTLDFRGNVPLIAISQSGETADTLFAVRKWKKSGNRCVGICNVPESTLTNEVDWTLHTRAGPEISVASTKAFTAQLTVLFLLALETGLLKGRISKSIYKKFLSQFREIPVMIKKILNKTEKVIALAKRFHHYKNFLYLGRWLSYPVAMEGALKLKEISYIHAEGYASGEMKHGPIALIDRDMPVVFVAPADRTKDKVKGNMEEVKAREGVIILVTDSPRVYSGLYDEAIKVEKTDEILTPFLTIIPLQLFAYHIAYLKGTDIDQPRNLAKSVTVE